MLESIKTYAKEKGLRAVMHEGTVPYVCIFGSEQELAEAKTAFPTAVTADEADVGLAAYCLGCEVKAGLRINL